jgi:amino acid transporter
MTAVRPAAAAAQAIAPTGRKRVLGLLEVSLFSVSAILVVDQLTATASIGVSAIGWWVVAVALFLVPSALITAELGTTYPDQGGIYSWVLRAFGRRAASRTTYWYWVNVALWMPSVYLLFTGVMVGLFWTDASVFEQSLMAIALVWITVGVGVLTLSVNTKITSISAAIKVAIIATIGIGAIVLAVRHGSANAFSVSKMLPHLGVAKIFLPVLIYQLLGFELVSSMSGEMKNPRRDVPRSILVAGLVVSAFYILGTVGMLLALPVGEIGLTQGLVETFNAIFGGGTVLVWILSIAVMATYFGNMVTWSLGANKTAAEAAAAGELPAILGRESAKGTPKWAFIWTGIIATVVLLFAGIFIKNQDNLYFAIFASSSAIFLLPYLLMYPAAIRLRRIDPDADRPFRVPGGTVGLWVAVILTTGTILASLVLFIWTPGAPISWAYTAPLLVIVAVAVLAGEVIIARCFSKLPNSATASSKEHA